jgi:hypothetical protein
VAPAGVADAQSRSVGANSTAVSRDYGTDTGLVKGKTIGIGATTPKANAALRSIVRRDTDVTYDEFLTRLAQVSGIEAPTASTSRGSIGKRKHKGSNEDPSA